MKRSLQQTFNYLADFSTTEQWDVNVLQANKLTLGMPTIGTEFQILAKTGRNKTPMSYKILDLDPNCFLELRGEAENFTLVDTIRFEALSEHQTRVHYTINIQMSGLVGKVVEKFPELLGPTTDRALNGLTRALNDEAEAIRKPSVLADRLVLPGMLNFTRRGYRKAKQHWKGIATDLTGKNAVITGATSGLGKETALALSKLGADVLVVVRDRNKAEELANEVELESGRPLKTVIADLSSVKASLAAVEEIKTQMQRIDILVNNAGALFNERTLTAENLENSFALLLLSPFVITEGLIDQLKAAHHARVINISSGGMYTQPIRLDDLQYRNEKYDGAKAYASAKRGLVDMTQVWAQKHPNISFNAMHPGWADTPAVESSLPTFYRITKPFLRSPKEGADTIIWLAAAQEPARKSGKFWLDRQAHSTAIFPGTRSTAKEQQALYSQLTQMYHQFAASAISKQEESVQVQEVAEERVVDTVM